MKIKVRMEDENLKCRLKIEGTSYQFSPILKDVQVMTRIKGDPYDGEYDIIPTFENQLLQTAQRYLEQDIQVRAIAVNKVTNLSGGYTISIGG